MGRALTWALTLPFAREVVFLIIPSAVLSLLILRALLRNRLAGTTFFVDCGVVNSRWLHND